MSEDAGSQRAAQQHNAAVAAGSVIVLRDDVELRVLMLRRQKALKFLGGFWVFPGGAADPSDIGAGAWGGVAAAARRELQEEAGLTVAVEDLVHWAHWITPSALARRFDTHFFIVRAPHEQQPCVSVAESSEFRWITQRDWECGAASGDIALTVPTHLVLRELFEALALHGSLHSLLERERNRNVRTVLPKLMDDRSVVMPWDPDYEEMPGEGHPWDGVGIAERAGWPKRLAAHLGRTR